MKKIYPNISIDSVKVGSLIKNIHPSGGFYLILSNPELNTFTNKGFNSLYCGLKTKIMTNG